MEHRTSKRLKDTLEARKEEYLSYLQDLIAIDTRDIGHGILGGKEKAGQEYLEKLLLIMKADEIRKDALREEDILACQRLYGEGNLGHDYTDRYNVYGLFEGKNKAKSLLFNGHMDTMPPGEEEKWRFGPFCPRVEDGRLYGLGAADMKSGLLAGVLAVKLLQDAGIDLPLQVKICSVCDEEGGGNGSMQALMSGERAEAVVVCEPSSGNLIIAHMGFVFFKVELRGKANHSGEKWAGVSAIDKAIKLIHALEELEHEWLLRYKHPLLPAPNLNVGTIHGGSAGSTVAGDCYFEVCVHYLPKQMSYESVYRDFTERIHLSCQGDAWLKEHPPHIHMYQSGGAFEEEEQADLVQAFDRANRAVKGKEVLIVGSPAGCDSRLWKNIAGAQVIQFGPGNLSECHAVDEFVELSQFYDAILLYAHLILEYGESDRAKEEQEDRDGKKDIVCG